VNTDADERMNTRIYYFLHDTI